MFFNIFELSSCKYVLNIKKHLGKGGDQALLIYKHWMRTGSVLFKHPSFNNCPSLVRQIIDCTHFALPEIHDTLDSGELKKVWLTVDGGIIEEVIIPMSFGYSLCVSSQVGCKMACTFCQTGRMGLKRSLTPSEIVAQLFIARNFMSYPIRNIVFMGMGEPFDNFDAVKQAIEVLTDENGFGIGPRHITISTSGRIDGIERMQNELPPQINLALSVNAPNDLIRTKIMPVTRKYNMEKLKNTLISFCQNGTRTVLAEYVLLKDINDSLSHADELAAYLQGIPVTVNLIPYNPQNPDRYERPSQDTIEQFKSRLKSHGLTTLLRTTKGSDIMAACGQLGKKTLV